MRKLSKIERKITQNICTDYMMIGGLLKEQLEDIIIKVNHELRCLDLIIEKKDSDKNFNKKKEEKTYLAITKIVNTIHLIEYLKANGYVILYHAEHGYRKNPSIGNSKFIEKRNNNESSYYSFEFPDEKIKELFFNYLDLVIHPTESLKHYVKKNYRTPEDIKHNRILIISAIAITVSILLGLMGFFKQTRIEEPIEINIQQFKELKGEIKSIYNLLDSIRLDNTDTLNKINGKLINTTGNKK